MSTLTQRDNDLRLMKIAVRDEAKRTKNDLYDQQRAINNAISCDGFSHWWKLQDTDDYLLDLEREAQEALGLDV